MVRSFSTTTQTSWRKSFEEFLKTNNIGLQELYQVDIKKLDGKTSKLVNAEFKGSLYHAVSTLFPEKEWHPWKFQDETLSSDFWKEQSNQRKFFDDLAKELGVQNLDDWYQKLSFEVIVQNGGRDFVQQYNNSPVKALMAAYPEHNWVPWKFSSIPRWYWKEQSNQQKFFDDLGKKIGIRTLDDWYQKLSFDLVVQHGEEGPSQFKRSPVATLQSAYPDHKWIPWNFRQLPERQRKDLPKQRKFFDDLGKKIGVQTLDDWYEKLSFDLVAENGGSGLLKLYSGSPQTALMVTYPEHKWISSNFRKTYSEYWKDPQNQRKFFDDLGKQIGVQTLDDWYEKLSNDSIIENGGRLLLKQHNNSPITALVAAYPEHNWVTVKFTTKLAKPRNYWSSPNNVKDFLSEVSEKLSIQTLDDWYRVDWKQLSIFGAATLLLKYKGLYNILKEQYPHHPWDPRKLQHGGKKGQRWLAVTLKKMFPNEADTAEILEDYLHPKLTLTSSNRPLQLDVFIPSKSLAFEYQGIQHYEEIGVFSPSKTYQQRDEEKRNLCAANNIKLIEVPYWWNRTQGSLQDIINKAANQ